MRILRVAQKVYPEFEGGGSYHVHAMSRDQAAMGHDVTVLTVGENAESERRGGYTVVRCQPWLSPLGNDIAPGIWRELRRREYDVVHAHSHLYFSTNLAAVARALDSTPLAITNHGLYSQTVPERVFDVYLRTLGRWTFNQADVVFCYTDVDEKRLRGCGVLSPIEVVPNGIDTERFRPEGSESELIDYDGSVVLFVGRLVEGKRPDDAIAAVKTLSEDVELYICGDGPLREELEARAGERCTFLGSVPYEEMPALYRAADVLVLPSRAEGTPRTVMEALSTGVPTVCSDLPHVRSAFGKAVSYFDCGAVGELAEEIESSLGKEEVVGLDDQFSWKRTVRETTKKLEDVIDGSV